MQLLPSKLLMQELVGEIIANLMERFPDDEVLSAFITCDRRFLQRLEAVGSVETYCDGE